MLSSDLAREPMISRAWSIRSPCSCRSMASWRFAWVFWYFQPPRLRLLASLMRFCLGAAKGMKTHIIPMMSQHCDAPKLCILQKHIQQDEIWEVECKPTSLELSLNARREDLHVVIMQYVYALSNKKVQTTKVVKVNANDCNSIAIVLLASIARKGSAASKARLHPSTSI